MYQAEPEANLLYAGVTCAITTVSATYPCVTHLHIHRCLHVPDNINIGTLITIEGEITFQFIVDIYVCNYNAVEGSVVFNGTVYCYHGN